MADSVVSVKVVSKNEQNENEMRKFMENVVKNVPDNAAGIAVVWFTRYVEDGELTVSVKCMSRTSDPCDHYLLPHMAFHRLSSNVNGD